MPLWVNKSLSLVACFHLFQLLVPQFQLRDLVPELLNILALSSHGLFGIHEVVADLRGLLLLLGLIRALSSSAVAAIGISIHSVLLSLEVLLLNLEDLLELHALSRLEPIELVVELLVLNAKLPNHINEPPVLLHDVLVLVLVADRGGLLALSEHLDTVLEVALLAHVLLLDVFIDDGALDLLVLDEVIKLLVDGLLELLVVVDVLHNPVDRILLAVDCVIVHADDRAELGDLISHRLLLDTEVVNLEA